RSPPPAATGVRPRCATPSLRLQTELGQAARVVRPPGLDADEELEVDTRPEQGLEPLPRARTDLAQPLPLRPDDDGLVALARDQDGGGDHRHPLLCLLLEPLDDGRGAVRHLVTRDQEDLL